MASAPEKLSYASAGVDIDAGDAFAASIRGLMRRTHGPRVIANDGGFAGLLRLDYNEAIFKRNYRDPVLVACTDGVGTKIKLAEDLAAYDCLGVDLVAMNVNDLVVQGAEPLLFLDYIACGRVDRAKLTAIVSGVADACASCGCALLGGETAEMPGVYDEHAIDLAGFAVGVVELSRAQDPSRVEPGDVVIGLESDGVHSNGFTLVRKIIERADADLRTPMDELGGRSLGEELLIPTRVYAGPISKLLRRYTVKRIVTGMAHITGGGLADNLRRALHGSVDAVVDRSKWPVPPVFGALRRLGDVDGNEMDRGFNMGIGFALLVRPSFAHSVERQLAKLGERPHVIGRIVAGEGDVRIG